MCTNGYIGAGQVGYGTLNREAGIAIWQLGDTEWAASADRAGAEQALYLEHDDPNDELVELTADQLDRYEYVDEEGRQRPFRAELRYRIDDGQQFPQWFATAND